MFNLRSTFFSMASALVLMLIFAIASGAATIIESVKSTQVAWALVYGTSWFALIQLLLGINLAYNIYRYNLINLKKLPALMFHISFIVILIGAAITRYFGFEGDMHIRENSQTNIVTTKDSYISLNTILDSKEYKVSSRKTPINIDKNDLLLSLDLPKGKAQLKLIEQIPNAGYRFNEAKDGEPVIELVLSKDQSREDVYLLEGEKAIVDDISFLFNVEPKENEKRYVLFLLKDNKFSIKSSDDLNVFNMMENSKQILQANKIHDFSKVLYTIGDINFAPKTILSKAKRKLQSVPNGNFDAITAELSYNGQKKEVDIFYNIGRPTHISLDGLIFAINWGASELKLPFSFKLNDFELSRYPGSNSPMSYASEITVLENNQSKFDYRIFMNNVLDYKGYRFFQSSYDNDEKGTILSVNKDPGKIPTYIGYFLLCLGLVLNIFNKNSRFRQLSRAIDETQTKIIKKYKTNTVLSVLIVSIILMTLSSPAIAIDNISKMPTDKHIPSVSKEHSKDLATLIVQSNDGRMKPFDTVSREVLNKFHRSDKLEGMESNAALLSLMSSPDYWQSKPIIAVGNSNKLKEMLGIEENAKYASFDDFFKYKDGGAEYKLTRAVEAANRKHPGSRDTFDKDVIKVDERVNVLYMVFTGEIFKIFPKPNDENHTWYTPASAMMLFEPKYNIPVASLIKNYFSSVTNAISGKGTWNDADKALDKIKEYQIKYGKKVMPSQSKLDAEITFNKLNIFDRLTPIYLIIGVLLLILVFVKILIPKLNLNLASKIVVAITLLSFIAHTLGLALRWYISGHAPWSNAYESLVYIAWALALSGILFSKRSPIALSLTTILAGITLFVAHLSWLDPQITTLVPVLQSYWLTIHVSVITASYGFLGLCAMLGFFVLILMAMQGKKPNPNIERNISEATRINEMAMILGLSLLTMGNFLGGVWANESWGRYWGWDSKETWALVSILIYSIVLHIRFIPKLNNQYAFAVFSMFAYWSIIMTYFGVNFYLAGMHSYASGDPLPIPNFVYISFATMVALSIIAIRGKELCKKL